MKTRKNHVVYINSLNMLVDLLFEEAYRQKKSWPELAEASGLSYGTVRALGERKTKYPQYRTVQLLAHGLGGKVQFSTGSVGKRKKVSWTPKVFAA